MLQRLHDAFELAEGVIEKDSVARAVPRFLFVRSHSAYLAACRLAMSGQQVEAHAVLRAGLEHAWYALHIAEDPKPFTRAEIWLQRNESAEAEARCKSEFTAGNVRRTHEARDAKTALIMDRLYKDLIDFGAHPNQLGVLTSVGTSEEANAQAYQVGILYPDPASILFTLRLAVAVGVGALKILRLVYPERFDIMDINSEIDGIVDQSNTIFRAHAAVMKLSNA